MARAGSATNVEIRTRFFLRLVSLFAGPRWRSGLPTTVFFAVGYLSSVRWLGRSAADAAFERDTRNFETATKVTDVPAHPLECLVGIACADHGDQLALCGCDPGARLRHLVDH